jgi:adenosylmethionine-8-amino-7-oxononanoate aminotransferase
VQKLAYCAGIFYTSDPCEKVCQELVRSTGGEMTRAYLVSSGSEAMEAAMKLARQYFLEKSAPEPDRSHFIARRQSYHGTTLGSLSMGGHEYRREKFQPMLLKNISKVSPCFEYRYRGSDDSAAYVAKLAEELDAEFERLEGKVCAFVAEPVVGAALGCVPSVRGYLQAVKAVCDKHGALLIFDEVMCGMGRTGTMHAWQHEGVVPDIQTIGKGLGGGYQPVAGVLVKKRVVDALAGGSGAFVHGHTFQGHPVAGAAALAVLQEVQDKKLLRNVVVMGTRLSDKLRHLLGDHPHVGDIRGRGMFWGIEFVADKATGLPFRAAHGVSMALSEMGLSAPYSISVYPGAGTFDGVDGDHIIVSPAYNTTADEIDLIAQKVYRLVTDFFAAAKLDEAMPE